MKHHTTCVTPEIRKLGERDISKITHHFMRLDQETRSARFGAFVKDAVIKNYAEHVIGIDTLVFGAFVDGELRAIGELRGLLKPSPQDAELALSVEPDWQEKGIGSTLFSRLMAASQNRGIKTLHVFFSNQNKIMQSIAARHHPEITLNNGQIEATIDPPWATPVSYAKEIAEDAIAYFRQVFQATA
ncbi:MAG: GNAT family N-acetyltransferase [Rhodobacterales bacterium]|nr:GNAT family N-acetyltransferase [Rhodobacterales bacterium]